MTKLPILYSFRRCPYAIRARLAIKISGIQVELREVLLADKPKALLDCSPKGTVPVLVLPDGSVIDESRDIVLWALNQHDPQNWLSPRSATQEEVNSLIDVNDSEFKLHLDHYKYADRFPEESAESYRQQAKNFLQLLEDKLKNNQYLTGNTISLADMALLPFIRQFAYVDKAWFDQSQYKNLHAWLDKLLAEKLFSDVMEKYARWQPAELMQ